MIFGYSSFEEKEMSVLEIVLLIMGIVIFIGSFLIPERKTRSGKEEAVIDEKKIHDLVAKEVEEAQGKITDIVDETITYAMEKDGTQHGSSDQ